MFRNRSFVVGLGFGIILGALLLQLAIEGEKQSGKSVLFEEQPALDANYTQEEVDRLLAEAREQALAEAAVSTPDTQGGGEDEKPLVRIVKIPRGTTLEKTAEMLQDYGLIEDKLYFVSSMRANSGKIRSGTFYFEGRPTEEDVKETITNDPILSFPDH
ncbi:hypothetical protein AB6A23_11645 [Paenibacillus tarimensis]